MCQYILPKYSVILYLSKRGRSEKSIGDIMTGENNRWNQHKSVRLRQINFMWMQENSLRFLIQRKRFGIRVALPRSNPIKIGAIINIQVFEYKISKSIKRMP